MPPKRQIQVRFLSRGPRCWPYVAALDRTLPTVSRRRCGQSRNSAVGHNQTFRRKAEFSQSRAFQPTAVTPKRSSCHSVPTAHLQSRQHLQVVKAVERSLARAVLGLRQICRPSRKGLGKKLNEPRPRYSLRGLVELFGYSLRSRGRAGTYSRLEY